jgi:hypothetical protein
MGEQQGDAAPAEPDRPESVGASDRDGQPLDVDAQIDQILETAATPKDGALAVFSAVVAPVPGYEDQPAVVPQDGEWLFGDRAIRLVLGQVDQLSEPELDAVRDALDDPAPPPPGQRGRSARPAAHATVDVARLQATAEEMVGVLGAAFGHRLQTGVTVRSVDTMIGDGFASTDPARGLLNRDADGDPVLGSTCLIQVGPRFARANDSTMRSAMAHEVFHCLQDEVFGDPGSTPEWFHEGVAAWVGLTYGADVPFFANWWNTYLDADEWTLGASNYDALGMLATLNSAGVDIAGFVRSAFAGRDGSDAALNGLLDSMVPDAAVAQLGPSPARRPDWGPRWVAGGVGLGGTDQRREPSPVLVDRSATVSPADTGNLVRSVGFVQQGAVVITVEGTAYGAWRWGDLAEDLTGPVAGRYCGTEPCLCPDGSPVPGGPYARIPDGELTMGVASLGTRTSSVVFTVTPIEELCEPEPTAPEGLYATLDGLGGSTWTAADGPAYCTAEQTGGAWVLSIGSSSGKSFNIATRRPPTEPGPQPDVNVFWSSGTTPYMNAPGLVLSFDEGLRSGTFSGEALDPMDPAGRNTPISGSFDCADGGDPPAGSAPWTGG